jgi:hypothetical protein
MLSFRQGADDHEDVRMAEAKGLKLQRHGCSKCWIVNKYSYGGGRLVECLYDVQHNNTAKMACKPYILKNYASID